MANRMAEVAKLLGVELMETFKIADDIFWRASEILSIC